MMPLYADHALAALLERKEAEVGLEAMAAAREVRADWPVARLDVAGGHAVFLGAASPLTQVIGIGMTVPVTEEHINQLEQFNFSRGAAAAVHVCPYADAMLLRLLVQRSYEPVEINTVLVRRLAGLPESAPGAVHCRLAGRDELRLWQQTVGEGFFERRELSQDECDLGSLLFYQPSGLAYLAEKEGHVLGAGGLFLHETVALFAGDATVPAGRRQGVHLALILARLQEAAARGCTLAHATTLPGSASQRNYERAGFQVMYTKGLWRKEPPAVR